MLSMQVLVDSQQRYGEDMSEVYVSGREVEEIKNYGK